MSGYWENMYGNQPSGRLWHQKYSSSEACRAAQAETGSAVRFDQCAYVDTTPAVQDITIIQDPLLGIKAAASGIPKEYLLLGLAAVAVLWWSGR